ncbi:hypothetical protein HDU97_002978 [Phlyctochytrium planicorne]|nr:hypothetical protein HDU97_002978 [Phlyctochytrium planicorne]
MSEEPETSIQPAPNTAIPADATVHNEDTYPSQPLMVQGDVAEASTIDPMMIDGDSQRLESTTGETPTKALTPAPDGSMTPVSTLAGVETSNLSTSSTSAPKVLGLSNWFSADQPIAKEHFEALRIRRKKLLQRGVGFRDHIPEKAIMVESKLKDGKENALGVEESKKRKRDDTKTPQGPKKPSQQEEEFLAAKRKEEALEALLKKKREMMIQKRRGHRRRSAVGVGTTQLETLSGERIPKNPSPLPNVSVSIGASLASLEECRWLPWKGCNPEEEAEKPKGTRDLFSMWQKPSYSWYEDDQETVETEPQFVDSPFFCGLISVLVGPCVYEEAHLGKMIVNLGNESLKTPPTQYAKNETDSKSMLLDFQLESTPNPFPYNRSNNPPKNVRTRKRKLTLRIQGRFKHEHSVDDVVFGTEFEKQLVFSTSAKPPLDVIKPAVQRPSYLHPTIDVFDPTPFPPPNPSFRMEPWDVEIMLIDWLQQLHPAMVFDVTAQRPYMWNPLLCSMTLVDISQAPEVELKDKDNEGDDGGDDLEANLPSTPQPIEVDDDFQPPSNTATPTPRKRPRGRPKKIRNVVAEEEEALPAGENRVAEEGENGLEQTEPIAGSMSRSKSVTFVDEIPAETPLDDIDSAGFTTTDPAKAIDPDESPSSPLSPSPSSRNLAKKSQWVDLENATTLADTSLDVNSGPPSPTPLKDSQTALMNLDVSTPPPVSADELSNAVEELKEVDFILETQLPVPDPISDPESPHKEIEVPVIAVSLQHDQDENIVHNQALLIDLSNGSESVTSIDPSSAPSPTFEHREALSLNGTAGPSETGEFEKPSFSVDATTILAQNELEPLPSVDFPSDDPTDPAVGSIAMDESNPFVSKDSSTNDLLEAESAVKDDVVMVDVENENAGAIGITEVGTAEKKDTDDSEEKNATDDAPEKKEAVKTVEKDGLKQIAETEGEKKAADDEEDVADAAEKPKRVGAKRGRKPGKGKRGRPPLTDKNTNEDGVEDRKRDNELDPEFAELEDELLLPFLSPFRTKKKKKKRRRSQNSGRMGPKVPNTGDLDDFEALDPPHANAGGAEYSLSVIKSIPLLDMPEMIVNVASIEENITVTEKEATQPPTGVKSGHTEAPPFDPELFLGKWAWNNMLTTDVRANQKATNSDSSSDMMIVDPIVIHPISIEATGASLPFENTFELFRKSLYLHRIAGDLRFLDTLTEDPSVTKPTTKKGRKRQKDIPVEPFPAHLDFLNDAEIDFASKSGARDPIGQPVYAARSAEGLKRRWLLRKRLALLQHCEQTEPIPVIPGQSYLRQRRSILDRVDKELVEDQPEIEVPAEDQDGDGDEDDDENQGESEGVEKKGSDMEVDEIQKLDSSAQSSGVEEAFSDVVMVESEAGKTKESKEVAEKSGPKWTMPIFPSDNHRVRQAYFSVKEHREELAFTPDCVYKMEVCFIMFLYPASTYTE